MPARFSFTLLACASAVALSACKDDRPPAPAAYDFANAPPAPVDLNASGHGGYALAERAHGFDQATWRAPPSYSFRYGDEEPWAWRTADDYSMYAEPYGRGYRSYYYAPGADYPYFVRDDDYAYGYGPDGVLVAAYDASGALLPRDRLPALSRLAGTYLVRASAIRRYALDDRYRVYVSDDSWAAHAPRFHETRQVWYAAPERQPRWRDWRLSHPREAARDTPRGEVRRWTASDDRAWKVYEQTDRRAWRIEDRARRRTHHGEDRRVALAAPPPPPVVRAFPADRVDERRLERRPEARPPRAVIEPPRARRPDRAQLATVEPRPAPGPPEHHAREPGGRPERPQVGFREHRGNRHESPAQLARDEPRRRPEARSAEAHQQPAAAVVRPIPQRQEARGPAPHAKKGAGKPDREG